MNSLDTNILVYAINVDCSEHEKAKAVYASMLDAPADWILSDQVLFEFYRIMRNPKVISLPLSHAAALDQIVFLREETGVLHCSYETSFWNDFLSDFKKNEKKSSHIFDRILGVTLLKNKVETFYTRNTKDFTEFGFQTLLNPID
ncbi:MAG: PIN domain-containing protein [Verrucomicrobia bacterium]|nr:PIN domain-containing protein [Verrucomicrobiota bacterium]